ncbi:Argonaute [Heracleum sosnowskyi]|uniref:Argonaute n=1 Tax=Heracleum sosnowskyi TaxID=360622 RepID=A0AAD8J5R6_9APIA|nr:Argonaute [Heracleum sosnowskyi]
MSGRGRGGGGRFEGGRGGGRGDGGRGRGDGGRGRGDGGRGGGRGDGGRGGGYGGRGGGYDGGRGGGGRGGGGGYRDQNAPVQAYGRGGNVPAPVAQPVMQPPVQAPVQAPVLATNAEASSSSVVALSEEVEKMTIGASAGPSVQQPVKQPPARPPASSKAVRLPVRPGYGRAGRKCIVRANHFLVKVADNDLHHYDVTIKPEVTNKKVCRDIMKSLDKSYRQSHLGNKQLAYDGSKSAYTAGPLPFISKDFVVQLEESDRGTRREREFRVSIKFASQPDLHHLRQFLASRQLDVPHETIQLFDVVLRATPSNNNAVVGRSFFNTLFGKGELGDGLEFWKGFYQSLRPTQMGLSLNVDMSARAFYEPIWVSDFVKKYCNLRDLNRALSDMDRVKVKKALRGIRVEFSHGDYMRRYKVLSISTLPLGQLTFTDETGGMMYVTDYFRMKYNINLTYTYLPALNSGTDAKPIYMPMEVCKIVKGQRCAKKLNERQVTSLLRATCQRPSEREASIKEMIRQNNYNGDGLVSEFGIQVGSDMTSIEARVLNPPKVKYHPTSRESVVEPFVGQWNMIDKKMVNGGAVKHWTCVNFSRNHPDAVYNFCNELVKMCRSRGMDFNPQPLLPIQGANPRYIARTLNDIHKDSESKLPNTEHLQMLIIVLPDVTGSYGEIKRVCETNLGIVSQCCQPKHVSKCNKQYLENLSLKINVKVGGRNNVLVSAPPVVRDCPTIIFGADVTHPAPGEDSSASIAAVVASMDWPEVTKYRALYSAQGHRDEIIRDLYSIRTDPQKGVVHSGMIRDHLRAFRRATNLQPRRIIFYRDGVSESQFSEVLSEEMDAIRKACQSLQEDYLPPVTFVVVQKRHHTRLFPAVHNDRRSTDKSGNILPGTVVDTTICHPTEFDFYLCSHAGIQGTSRPTHYHVLFDENNFSADDLQALTNNLTYTYARCTRSVSIVPPAYYAHLTAFRARYYMEGNTSDGDSSSEARATREGIAAVRSVPATRDNVKEVMFYC